MKELHLYVISLYSPLGGNKEYLFIYIFIMNMSMNMSLSKERNSKRKTANFRDAFDYRNGPKCAK